jgi:hypothetical protein
MQEAASRFRQVPKETVSEGLALELLEGLQSRDRLVRAAKRPRDTLGRQQVIDGDLIRTPGTDSLLRTVPSAVFLPFRRFRSGR